MRELALFGSGDELIAHSSRTRKTRLPSSQGRRVEREGGDIAVFVCRCGGAVSRTVNVESVATHASRLEAVKVARVVDFACSKRGRDDILRSLTAGEISKYVVAGCTPGTHEQLFRSLSIEAGINPYTHEIANIREQCAFVHSPEEATRKAILLVEAAVAKCRALTPAPHLLVPIASDRIVVVGGGLAAAVAALSGARQGHEVALVVGESAFGSLDRVSDLPIEAIERLSQDVRSDRLIRVIEGSDVLAFEGKQGDFRLLLRSAAGEEDVRCGAVILALEAVPEDATGDEQGLEGVVSQRHFRSLIESGTAPDKVVMLLEPVGEPGSVCDRGYATQAISNALSLKELRPSAQVSMVGGEVRTYGMCELDYRRAQESGVRFVRTRDKPKIVKEGGLKVLVTDADLGSSVELPAELIVADKPPKPLGTDNLARVFGIAIDSEGYFRRTHVKLKPAATLRKGVFLCGSASGPKMSSEELLEASAAASRAVALVSRRFVEVGGEVAEVEAERCSACLSCVRICPYNAPFIGEAGKAEIDVESCEGCGTCVGICPSKAIQMYGYSDAQLDTQSRVLAKGGEG